MTQNVVNLPTYGKAISLDEQGVYFTLNPNTGAVLSVIQLVYDDEWYLLELQKPDQTGETGWIVMADEGAPQLVSMSTTELRQHFSKPEYEEPRGAWQVIRNGKYGLGKFTPAEADAPVCHAIIMFSGNEMQPPVRLYKADEASLKRAQEEAQTETASV